MMATINDVLSFLNKVDLVGDLDDNDYIDLKEVKKVLVNEFLDVDSDKLENMMGVVDGLQISFIIQDFQIWLDIN